MRLYVVCPSTSRLIYLSNKATSRQNLPELFVVRCPFEGVSHTYRRINVNAEPERGVQIGGAILGGIIGLIGGPLGLIVGGLAGAFLGDKIENSEARQARLFNEEQD